MIEKLIQLVKKSNIENIYLIGFVDVEDGTAQFYHDLKFIYFEINNKYIEFESIEQFSKLKIRIVDIISYDFEIDEDMIKAKSSISEVILNDTMSNGNNIGNIVFYNLEECKDLICDAVEIKLVNGQVIFLDPSFYFGINIGGKEQKEMWKLNLEKGTSVSAASFKISNS